VAVCKDPQQQVIPHVLEFGKEYGLKNLPPSVREKLVAN
jgi:hypothetical protein